MAKPREGHGKKGGREDTREPKRDEKPVTRRGAKPGEVLPPEDAPNVTSPVPDEYRRDPSDDGLPDSG